MPTPEEGTSDLGTVLWWYRLNLPMQQQHKNSPNRWFDINRTCTYPRLVEALTNDCNAGHLHRLKPQ